MEMTDKLAHFKRWVFWTGIFNIVVYTPLASPYSLQIYIDILNALIASLGLSGSVFSFPMNINNLVIINVFGFVIGFLGILLIIASFDLENRAWFVFWEGILRIAAFFMCAYFFLFKDASQMVLIFGLSDLIIGGIYQYYIFTIEGLRKT